jgi:2-polyprenyl-3-methyl-5-hydroxy-6-metoxy-1,4-benzoquinol methylase
VKNIPCHVCASQEVKEIPGFGQLSRVTSDCQPWERGGRLCFCIACKCAQKIIDSVWEDEIEKIYQNYSIYQQGDGAEQVVFAGNSDQSSPRSVRILEFLQENTELTEKGRLLDIGCGNGALLRAFNRTAPKWSLVGTELNEKYRELIEGIVGVERLYTCAPEDVPGTFNLITMVHVLEHIVSPKDFLVSLRDKLSPDGLLMVEVPNYRQNPFDLLIADHITHFSPASVRAVIQNAGFEIIALSANWVPKELTIIARKLEDLLPNYTCDNADETEKSVSLALQWLESVVEDARQAAVTGDFGLLGTSIAATWLFSELGDSVDFFVDEDPYRIGKSYMGRPVFHPSQVQEGSKVFLALPTHIAQKVKERMESQGMDFECFIPSIMMGSK